MAELVGCFLMDQAGIDAYAEGGRVMTDDRPWAEFVAPKTVYQRTVQDTLGEIMPHVAESLTILERTGIDSDTLARLDTRHRARRQDLEGVRRYYGGLLIDPSIGDAFKTSLAIDPENNNAKFYLRQVMEAVGRSRLDWEEYEEAEAQLLDAIAYVPEARELHLLLADVYVAWGKPAEAREAYARYQELGGTASREIGE
jgi:tetratricopeptide (TPR) repeat protein